MKIIADLHLHSKYSRAVSQHMVLTTMALWAEKKGIDLLAIPDWTHPIFLKEVESVIKEAGPGIYQLKDNSSEVRFIFSTEISSIYTQGGKGRRIHNLVMAPSLAVVNKINDELKKRGCNLMSDGRPIISLSSSQLAELVFGIDSGCLIVPAHIWTPWFSMFGSRSGFDSLEECWGKYTDQIYAIETGLSSDPAMNWQIGQLAQKSILSFSDAHSPSKMGREATVFKIKSEKLKTKNKSQKSKKQDFSFSDLVRAIKQDESGDWEIAYTIEFYPEEGKYHWTGHRNCGVSFSPQETKKKGVICPVCGRPLTVGVEHRVQDLASIKIKKTKKTNQAGMVGYYNQGAKRPPYIMIVPLQEIIAEALGIKSVYSQKVQGLYENLVNQIAPEFELLTQSDLAQIKQVAGDKVAEAVKKVRLGDIVVKPGFDGEFGIVKIWEENQSEKDSLADSTGGQTKTSEPKEQMSLF